jgi:hypothetical protein
MGNFFNPDVRARTATGAETPPISYKIWPGRAL